MQILITALKFLLSFELKSIENLFIIMHFTINENERNMYAEGFQFAP